MEFVIDVNDEVICGKKVHEWYGRLPALRVDKVWFEDGREYWNGCLIDDDGKELCRFVLYGLSPFTTGSLSDIPYVVPIFGYVVHLITEIEESLPEYREELEGDFFAFAGESHKVVVERMADYIDGMSLLVSDEMDGYESLEKEGL